MCVLTADSQCFPPDQDGCHFDFRNSDWLICENDIISTARMTKICDKNIKTFFLHNTQDEQIYLNKKTCRYCLNGWMSMDSKDFLGPNLFKAK